MNMLRNAVSLKTLVVVCGFMTFYVYSVGVNMLRNVAFLKKT
jgi:hypothetical protein